MANISWGTIKSLLIFFGPLLLPRIISWYRGVSNAPKRQGLAVKPAPPAVRRALFVLGTVATVLLLTSLPPFAPENLFVATQSRLQIPVDVLFTRLSALRPNSTLTAQDTALRTKFVNLESRLLYLQHGPDVLADCPFCRSDEPTSYFYYAIPALLTPHLVNLIILAGVTSTLLTGRDGGRWRTMSTMWALGLVAADLYLNATYNYQANSRALRLEEIEPFFWRMRVYRNVGLAVMDGLVGLALWLSSTNRAFGSPPTPAERVEGVIRALATARGKMNAAGIVKNTAIRDAELRERITLYWTHEAALMREVMEEREVIEGVNDALENRVDIQTITGDADKYAQSVLNPADEPILVGS